jgi:two-component system, cell cycle response regulator
MTQRPFRSIASVLIRRTIVLAVLCMLAVFAVQSWVLRTQYEKQLESVISDVANTSVPLVAAALWDIETQAVQAQLEFIAKKPEIGHVRLQASGGQSFTAGDPTRDRHGAARHITVYAPHGPQALGVLSLSGNPDYLQRVLLSEGLRILLGYSTLTAGICVLIAFMLKQLLQKPLSTVVGFAHGVSPQQPAATLRLNRPPRRYSDEIDLLEQGVTTLQSALQEHIHNLDGLVTERTSQLERLLAEIRHLSVTDALTGTFNRRALQEKLPAEIERAERYGRPLSVIFMDIDHFKQFNDVHGHALGDEVLRSTASQVSAALRHGVDWVARYGGEEFVVVLPETGLEAAMATAYRLCQALPQHPVLTTATHGPVHISASFGVTAYRSGENASTLLSRADAWVYEAKSAGRQQVVGRG